MKVAVTGKGGVGKTVIAGTLACLLQKKGFEVLAVDADPNPNLSYTLGLARGEAEKIVPISENSELIEEKTGAEPRSYDSVFKLNFTVDDIIEKYAVRTPLGVNLLVMGVVREAAAGCMCPANHLLRMLLRHLLVQREEAVVADMEAGTEHLGRGTAEHVGGMLVVVEPSAKAFETACWNSCAFTASRNAAVPRAGDRLRETFGYRSWSICNASTQVAIVAALMRSP